MTAGPGRTRVYWQLAAITCVGAALRLYHLDYQSLWHDEAISVIVGRAPLDRIFDFFRATEGRLPTEYNPPFYFLLLHGWFRVFGAGGFEARLLSAVAGVLSLPLIFLLARRICDESAGLYAALLLAVSQIGVMFSQEARNYEVFLLLVIVTAYLYWIAMTRRNVAAWWTCVGAAVLMVATQYYGVFVILALAVFTLIYWRSIPWAWVAGAAAVGVAGLGPWLRFALGGQMRAASDRVQPEYFAINLSTLAGTINRFNNGAIDGLLDSAPVWAFPAGAVLFCGPLVYLLARALRKGAGTWETERRATVFAVLLLSVPLASVFALGLVFNVQYNIRYVSFCIAPYCLLVGAGLARLPHPVLRLAVAAAAVCYSGYALAANYRVPYKENYRDAIAFVTADAAPDDCYAFVPFGGPPLQWSIYPSPRPGRLLAIDGELPAAAGCRRVWVITYERVVIEAHRRWQEWLSQATAPYTRLVDRRFFWVRVERYDVGRLP